MLALLSDRPMSPSELGLAEAMAALVDARIGLVAELQQARARADQLQEALDSRVVIEQAKGVVAEQRDLDVDHAFELLRARARASGVRLRELAALVATQRVDVETAAAVLRRQQPHRLAHDVPLPRPSTSWSPSPARQPSPAKEQ